MVLPFLLASQLLCYPGMRQRTHGSRRGGRGTYSLRGTVSM